MEERLGNTGLDTEVSEMQIYGKTFIKNVLDRRKTPGKQTLRNLQKENINWFSWLHSPKRAWAYLI